MTRLIRFVARSPPAQSPNMQAARYSSPAPHRHRPSSGAPSRSFVHASRRARRTLSSEMKPMMNTFRGTVITLMAVRRPDDWRERAIAEAGRGRQRRAAAGKANWLTDGGDPQRSSWQRHETLISPASAKDMKLIWKLQLDNTARQLHNLLPADDRQRREDRPGPEADRRRGGVSDNIYGVDLDTGKPALEAPLRPGPDRADRRPRRVSAPAPAKPTATPVIGPTKTAGKFIAYAISWDGLPPSARRRDRRRSGAAGTVPAAERQAVWPESGQQRALC